MNTPTCRYCDRPMSYSRNGRLICVLCWTDEPAGTPALFAEWREGGELNRRRFSRGRPVCVPPMDYTG